MLLASPCNSARRMAVSAPERRGFSPAAAAGSKVVVSVTKDPFLARAAPGRGYSLDYVAVPSNWRNP